MNAYPLGLLMVGGALRGRAAVTRIDAARDHLTDADIVRRVAARAADVAMVAHVGSTQAHPCCPDHDGRPEGGECPGIVALVASTRPTTLPTSSRTTRRWMGSSTARGRRRRPSWSGRWPDGGPRRGRGAVGRGGDRPAAGWPGGAQPGPPAPGGPRRLPDRLGPRRDDWDRYRAFGLGRAAVVQFSRGWRCRGF